MDKQLKKLGFIPTVYAPHYSHVNDALVKTAHQWQMKIIPWTVNELPLMQKLVLMGVDGLISDYPDKYQHLILPGIKKEAP